VSFSEPDEGIGADPLAPVSTAAERQAHRREIRRRRGLRRLDVAIGVLLAVIALVVAPGVAVVAIGAVIVLVACGLSLLYGRRRARRARSRAGSTRPRRRRSSSG
jgi:Flp pilus assembly protein TadB